MHDGTGVLDGTAGVLADERTAERDERRQLVLFSLFGVLLGVVGAVCAWLLYHLINIFTGIAFYHTLTTQTPLYPPEAGLGAAAILVPVIGGLIVGLMVKYGTDRIRGHGIPEAMEAVLKNQSRISVKVAIWKPISAAVAVGTGGPFGAEGPIIQTGGAIGSLIGQTMRMSAKERRILLACGGAAGMVGIFNTPIAAVALALELLLFEFRARSLVPVILASATAAGLRSILLGSAVMFNIGSLPGPAGPLDLLWFVPLGLLVGLASVVLSKALYEVEEFFERLRVDIWLKPALGALVLGIVALVQPRVLGMGYTTITHVLQGKVGNGDLVSLGVGKSIALLFSLGAGTSGGLLAPMLLIGATIGTGFGRVVTTLLPAVGIGPGLCGIVAMSGLFSAAARAPLTSFLFAFELTGDYHALLPLMIGCMCADIVARSLSRESVMTERLARRGLRVNQGYEARLLTIVSVGEVMTRAVDALSATMTVREAVSAILGQPVALLREEEGRAMAVSAATAGDSEQGAACSVGLHKHWTFPVVGDQGRLVGMITRGELLELARSPATVDDSVGLHIQRQVVVAFPDESLDEALMRMLAGGYQLLPVVDRQDRTKVLGVLSREDILEAWQLRSREERQRERVLTIGLGSRWRVGGRTAGAPRATPAHIRTEPPAAGDDTLAAANVQTLTLPSEEAGAGLDRHAAEREESRPGG